MKEVVCSRNEDDEKCRVGRHRFCNWMFVQGFHALTKPLLRSSSPSRLFANPYTNIYIFIPEILCLGVFSEKFLCYSRIHWSWLHLDIQILVKSYWLRGWRKREEERKRPANGVEITARRILWCSKELWTGTGCILCKTSGYTY